MKYTDDMIADVMNTINNALESKGLIACCCEVDEPFLKIAIDEDVLNKNKITYKPVDDYKECDFYKNGEYRDLSEVDDYYLPPYRGNPFREGCMSGLWGEYEYYCPRCNLEITHALYDENHIEVGQCSKCPKCKENNE